MTTTTTIAPLDTLEEFETLAGPWDAMVRAMPRPSPFLLHGWLAEWWRHSGETPTVLVARRDGAPAGALPVVIRRRAGLRVASFMGGRTAVLPDVLLARAGDDADAEALVAALGDRCDVADLHGLPAESRIAAALGGRMQSVERIEAPVLDLRPGWDEVYRAKTNAKKRNLHRRRRRQLSELGELRVTVAREPGELGPALEEAFRLHDLRWDGRPDGSGFTSGRGKPFQRAAIGRLAAIDVPRIVSLELDGRAIAFHYWFALAGRMYVHRLAFDPALARFSPGLVNTLDALEAAAGEGLSRVEYLGGGERYKLELADAPEPLLDGFAVASGIPGRTYAATQMATIRARLRLKRSERLRRLYFDGVAPVRRARDRVSAARGGR
jgi:CelD/BcsL family acetyltransferase involved in cellulose biosynthesis